MAKSQKKTKLAIVRDILGPIAGGEARFAKMIGRSQSWLKKASCGTIPLTADAAVRISHETGVCPFWLLDENNKRSPNAADTFVEPFTKGVFDERRAALLYGSKDLHEETVDCLMGVAPILREITAIVASAVLTKKVPLTMFRLNEFAESLEKEFGPANPNTAEISRDIFEAALAGLPKSEETDSN